MLRFFQRAPTHQINVDILMNMKLRLILMTTFIPLRTVCFLFTCTISTSNNCGSRVHFLPHKSTALYFYPMALTTHFLPEYNKWETELITTIWGWRCWDGGIICNHYSPWYEVWEIMQCLEVGNRQLGCFPISPWCNEFSTRSGNDLLCSFLFDWQPSCSWFKMNATNQYLVLCFVFVLHVSVSLTLHLS